MCVGTYLNKVFVEFYYKLIRNTQDSNTAKYLYYVLYLIRHNNAH